MRERQGDCDEVEVEALNWTKIDDDIAQQRRQLCARVEASGLYLHEVKEFDIAVAAHRELVGRLGVIEDLGSLTTAESRNLVRRVRLGDDGDAVLKVIGNTREPGEGELLNAWFRTGLSCVEPLHWGHVRVAHGSMAGTATYLVTRYSAGRPLVEFAAVEEPIVLVRRLVALVGTFHRADVSVSRARSWRDRMNYHLREVVPVMRQQRVREPRDWAGKLDQLGRTGRTVVHGDPGPSNVLVTETGLVLLDPPGALVATPEADFAQICCHVGRTDAPALLDQVSDDDEHLDPSALGAYAGLNLLVWAGYLLAAHYNPNVETEAPTRAERAADAEHHLEVSHQLLEGYRTW